MALLDPGTRPAARARGEPTRAVLFDLDGTLVDTTPLHFEAYRRTLAEHGRGLDWRTFLSLSGRAARETVPLLAGTLAESLGWRAVHARKCHHFGELIRQSPPPLLATADVLSLVAQQWPVGLVSAASRRTVDMVLEALAWQDAFEVVVTADDVAIAKPDPAGYLEGARALGVAPTGCLVFEDTDDGVAAGRAAGMRVIDVRQSLPAWRLAS